VVAGYNCSQLAAAFALKAILEQTIERSLMNVINLPNEARLLRQPRSQLTSSWGSQSPSPPTPVLTLFVQSTTFRLPTSRPAS
jgi:hypothetical protein